MASFERRFLTIKVSKFASTEAEVLVHTYSFTPNECVKGYLNPEKYTI